MTEGRDKDVRVLRQIQPVNLLSFGPHTPPLELKSLNVLIGINGVGKSNLIEALALMRATPVPSQTTPSGDVQGIVRRGGGVQEWIWKGAKEQAASIDLVINHPRGKQPLRHQFSFRTYGQRLQLEDERVENEMPYANESGVYFYYQFQDGHPVLNTLKMQQRKLARETVDLGVSILAQRRDPEEYPEITYLAETYEKWRIYREWAFGRNSVFREPQKADMRNDRLEEDFSNLGLFLSHLRRTPKAKRRIIEELKNLYGGFTDFEPIVEGGSVQVFFTEGDYSIPATRLSDGTLRYLCLLAILCDPTPPPLICIEEPELGLHPDILPKLADLLIEASTRTQLIVSTHSDLLVDAMTDHPDVVVVFEKHDGQTEMRRLDKDEVSKWLRKYRLGQSWIKGEIGGTRW